jgi:hypothetical protein
VSFLRRLESPLGIFKRLFGMLVSGLVIFFPVVYRRSTVRMGREFVEFGSSLVRVIWHRIPILGVHLKLIPRILTAQLRTLVSRVPHPRRKSNACRPQGKDLAQIQTQRVCN